MYKAALVLFVKKIHVYICNYLFFAGKCFNTYITIFFQSHLNFVSTVVQTDISSYFTQNVYMFLLHVCLYVPNFDNTLMRRCLKQSKFTVTLRF